MQVRSGSRRERWKHFLGVVGGAEYIADVRRINRRYTTSGEAKVTFAADGDKHTRSLKLLDVALDGLTTRGNNEIAPGTHLVVELDHGLDHDEDLLKMRGEVIHCTGTLGGFKIGISLDFREDDEDA